MLGTHVLPLRNAVRSLIRHAVLVDCMSSFVTIHGFFMSMRNSVNEKCFMSHCFCNRITHLTSTALRRVAYKEPRTEETSLSRWNFSMSTQYESRSSVAPPLANIRNYRRSSSMGATTGVHAASSMHSSYPSSAPHSLLIPGGCVCEYAPDVSPEHSDVEEEETTDAVAV